MIGTRFSGAAPPQEHQAEDQIKKKKSFMALVCQPSVYITLTEKYHGTGIIWKSHLNFESDTPSFSIIIPPLNISQESKFISSGLTGKTILT